MKHYFFDVTDEHDEVTKLRLTNFAGPGDSWKTTNPPTKLDIESGLVNSSKKDVLECKADVNNIVLSLLGAGWNSSVGDVGSVDCRLCSNCSPKQTWELVKIS